jgi:predicted nuclease of predicted toxin-antitoxin system
MKFLVDECTGMSVVTYLCETGHDVVAVVNVMPMADDKDILERAVSEDRIVVTNDKDFGELVYRTGWEHRGIILLRLRDERAANKIRMMDIVLTSVGERLQHHYVVVTETGIRVRNRGAGAQDRGLGRDPFR